MSEGAGRFGTSGGGSVRRALAHAARVAATDVLGVREKERALLIVRPGPDTAPVALAVHDALVAAGAETVLVSEPARVPGAPADPIVLRALETDPDILVTLTDGPLGVDPERLHRPVHGKYQHYAQYLLGEARTRGFWAPGVTPRVFARTVPIDYVALARDGAGLVALLREAEELRVTTPAGTDLAVPLDRKKARAEDGRYREPGQGGNLPAGEVLAPATEGGATGRLVVDGALGLPGGTVDVRDAVVARVEEGKITQLEGGAGAKALEKAFAAAGPRSEEAVAAGWLTRRQATVYAGNARRVAEIGLGLNPAARPSGDPLVDDKVRGGVHLGIGAASHESPPGAPVAIDAVLRRPTVVAVLGDGAERTLVREGRVLEAAWAELVVSG